MWLSNKAFELFEVSKETVTSLREDLAGIRAERDGLKAQLAMTQANFDWARVKVNALEMERAQLIKRLYGVDIPVPEVVRHNTVGPIVLNSALFEDVGEKAAQEMGLPMYS